MKKKVLKLVICLPMLLIGIALLLVKIFLWGIALIGGAILIYKVLDNANELQTNTTIKAILTIIGILFALIIITSTIQSEIIFIIFCILLIGLLIGFERWIWGKICQFVAVNKGYSPKYFWLGVILGLLGLLIVGFLRDNTVTKNNNDIDSLEHLAELKEKGIITEQEFEESKKKILSKL